jgi:hypothetical protein
MKKKSFCGSENKRITSNITLSGISPEARTLLNKILEEWEKHKTELHKLFPHQRETVYGFAYWLIRYSGLVKPN